MLFYIFPAYLIAIFFFVIKIEYVERMQNQIRDGQCEMEH
jgi:hypothetical protein